MDGEAGGGVREAETELAHKIEARIHEVGRELQQEYAVTAAFVKRIFAGMPAHVQPGSVAPYDVTQPEQPVIRQEDITQRKASWPPDITR